MTPELARTSGAIHSAAHNPSGVEGLHLFIFSLLRGGIVWRGIVLPALFAAVLSSSASAADRPWFIGLGDLPGGTYNSQVFAISADGTTVVGNSGSANGATEAFRWTRAGGIQGIGDLPGGGFSSIAYGVSGDGSVIVGQGNVFGINPGFKPPLAFRWENGVMTELPAVPAGSTGIADCVSADGSTVFGRTGGQTVRWTSAGVEPVGSAENRLTGISADGSIMVGNSRSGGFRWTASQGITPLIDCWPRAISGDGEVLVGGSSKGATMWVNGQVVTLGNLWPGGDSIPLAVSWDGSVIVGQSESATGAQRCPFLWTMDKGLRDLREVLISAGLNFDGWTLTDAVGISADGLTVVGNGYNPNMQNEAWIVHLPEPSSMATLVGLGFFLVRSPRPLRNRCAAH